MPHTISDLTKKIMTQAKEKGFGTKPKDIEVPEKIALIHSEISEAYEAYRRKKINGPHGFKEELSDALARILHLAGIFEIDLEKEIVKKIKTNHKRQWPWQDLNEKHS